MTEPAVERCEAIRDEFQRWNSWCCNWRQTHQVLTAQQARVIEQIEDQLRRGLYFFETPSVLGRSHEHKMELAERDLAQIKAASERLTEMESTMDPEVRAKIQELAALISSRCNSDRS